MPKRKPFQPRVVNNDAGDDPEPTPKNTTVVTSRTAPRVQWRFPTNFDDLDTSLASAEIAIGMGRKMIDGGRRDHEGTTLEVLKLLRNAARGIELRPARRGKPV